MKQKEVRQKVAELLKFKAWDYFGKKWVEGYKGVETAMALRGMFKFNGKEWSVIRGDGDDFELKLIVDGKYITSAVIPAIIGFDEKTPEMFSAIYYCIKKFGSREPFDINGIYMPDFMQMNKGARLGEDLVIPIKYATFSIWTYQVLEWLVSF